jgi:hypothetical protein
MTFRHAALLVLGIVMLGCATPYEITYAPDTRDASNGLYPGWKCPPSEKINHLFVVDTPACSWVWGAAFDKSCNEKYRASEMKALGCVQVPKVSVWFLMMPPSDADRRMNPSAPLQDWDIFARFKTAPECQTALASLKPTTNVAQRQLDLTQPARGSRQDEIVAAAPFAQCASSDVARPDQ